MDRTQTLWKAMTMRNRFHLSAFILLLTCLSQPVASAAAMLLFDFSDAAGRADWRLVNDGVMGGLSQSEIRFSGNGTATFTGIVSLENNGGFASIRTRPREYGLDGYDGIALRVRGDGQIYQFRIRTDDRFDGISYRYPFTTKSDEWIVVKVPFGACVPVFRGRVLSNTAPLVPMKIKQIGFLIAEKQSGPFELEVDWIKAYKD